ncbi:PAS domain-containing protein, partial [Acinetobacter baumannii]
KTMLGYAEQDIGNALSECSERVHPDDLPRVMADVQAHLDGRTPGYRNEHRMLCRNGEYKWILDRGKVISNDADGRPLRMVGTHTDITERRRVHTEL